jgi:hypothetical protein
MGQYERPHSIEVVLTEDATKEWLDQAAREDYIE